MLKRLGAVLVILGLALAVPAIPAAAAVPTTVPTGLNYVALGDSYSAGFGLLPVQAGTPAGCFRAEQNYPHLVAAALGFSLSDVTCSGAVTANITTTEQVTMPPYNVTVPLQGNALDANTDIVTVTIGGNDLGFADVAEFCIVLGEGLGPIGNPTLDNCREHYHRTVGGFEVDDLVDRLDFQVAPAVLSTFNYIKSKAPNAKIFAVGYPQIAPDFHHFPQGCYSPPIGASGLQPPFPQNTVPYTIVDTHYLNHIENLMDQTVQEAAQIAGVTYVPTWAASADHTVCTGANSYIFGVGLTNDANDGTETPLSGIYAKLGALHPNTTGVPFMAAEVIAAIQGHPSFGDPEPAVLPATGPAGPLLGLVGIAIALLGAGFLVAGRRRARS